MFTVNIGAKRRTFGGVVEFTEQVGFDIDDIFAGGKRFEHRARAIGLMAHALAEIVERRACRGIDFHGARLFPDFVECIISEKKDGGSEFLIDGGIAGDFTDIIGFNFKSGFHLKAPVANKYGGRDAIQHGRKKHDLAGPESDGGKIAGELDIFDAIGVNGRAVAKGEIVRVGIGERGSLASDFDFGFDGSEFQVEVEPARVGDGESDEGRRLAETGVFGGDGPRAGFDGVEKEMAVIVGGGLMRGGALRGNGGAGDDGSARVLDDAFESGGARGRGENDGGDNSE